MSSAYHYPVEIQPTSHLLSLLLRQPAEGRSEAVSVDKNIGIWIRNSIHHQKQKLKWIKLYFIHQVALARRQQRDL